MAGVVEQDPALSASIIKVINSPAIGMANKVTSISHAMSLLGLRSIMNIINAAFLKRTVDSCSNMEQLDSFWQSTTKVAIGIAAITRKLNLQKAGLTIEDAYCVGLFHNVGMPMLLDKHDDHLKTIKPSYGNGNGNGNGNPGIVETENSRYDTNHTVLGFYITKVWGLPKLLSDVIRHHHNIETLLNFDKLDENMATLLAALKMAEQIAGESEEFGGVDYNKDWIAISSTVTSFMGLSIDDFFDLEDYIFDAIEEELDNLSV
ncbi:MAG: HD-like signal output (HDOD) protein [Lentisphaeria bacterium]|jgi:HD-like signal output (HDOD) protein